MKWWLVVRMTGRGLFLLASVLAAVTPVEHARRIAKMKEIAALSNGKIEIIVEAEGDSGQSLTDDTRQIFTADQLALADTEAMGRHVQPAVELTAGHHEAKPVLLDRELNEELPRALHLIYTKNDQQALTILRKLLAARPESEGAALWQYWAGECCWNLGQFAEAKEHFSKAARERGLAKAELATFKLALIADKNNDRDSGKKLLTQLLHDYPDGDCVIIARPLLQRYGLN